MSQAGGYQNPHQQRWLTDLEIVSKINMCDVNEKPMLPLMDVVSEDGTSLSLSILEYSFA